MGDFSSFMVSFSSSCLLLGFLYMLCPSGNMKSPVRYVFVVCLLCCILSCVTDISKVDIGAFGESYQSEIVTEQSAAVTAKSIFEQALKDAGINYAKITVNTNKLTDGSITISRVTVYTATGYDEIKSIIGSDDYEVIVINE